MAIQRQGIEVIEFIEFSSRNDMVYRLCKNGCAPRNGYEGWMSTLLTWSAQSGKLGLEDIIYLVERGEECDLVFLRADGSVASQIPIEVQSSASFELTTNFYKEFGSYFRNPKASSSPLIDVSDNISLEHKPISSGEDYVLPTIKKDDLHYNRMYCGNLFSKSDASDEFAGRKVNPESTDSYVYGKEHVSDGKGYSSTR